MTKMNFAMGQAVDLKVDPTVCQNPSDCAQGPIDANNEQNNAVKVLTGGVRKKYRKFKGGVKFPEPEPPAGYYEVKPLPQGTQTTNTNDNNMEMNGVYASTQMNSKGDSEVKFGGRRTKRKMKTKKKKSRKILKGGSRKTTCVKQTLKKYITRKSPAYPANKCKNKKRKGNDGKFYISKAKGGTYKWVPFAKKK